jgi:hypothetical protein
LVIISYTTGLSFAEERIGLLAAIVTTVFYLLALYLLALPNTPENMFASIYSESLIKTTHKHLLLLVGFDTLIYRKYYDTPPILVGHQPAVMVRGEEEGASSGVVLEVALFRALSGQASAWQTGCCSTVPFVYACLLPLVAGAGVLMAGFSSPSAVVELLSLHLLSGIAGVGSPPYRAQP